MGVISNFLVLCFNGGRTHTQLEVAVKTEERNRHGLSLAEWDAKAKGLEAPKEFFAWARRKDYWWKGMSARWTTEHFRNVLIVRNTDKKAEDLRKKIGFKTGNRARIHDE